MSFTAAIDISTFIWCQDEFDTKRNFYYQLIDLASTMFEQVKEKRIPVLLRNELCQMLMAEFPYTNLNKISRDYGLATLTFLTNVSWFLYAENDATDASTDPNIIKQHFSENIKQESRYQIEHLYRINSPEHKFIAYYFFYNHKKNLLIEKEQEIIEIDTLWYQSEDQIIQFFEKHKIKFKHNHKHDKYKSGGKISPLSCYNERDGDTTQAQELLENSHLSGDNYFNYDGRNQVYVIFVISNDDTYHGFDLSDEGSNVPNEVKKTFNKNGRKF